MSQLRDADQLRQVKAAALRLLGRRARTVADLRKRLQQKGKYADHTIAEVVAWLTDQGYLDDARYAMERVSGLLRDKRMGRAGLVARLVSEGVERALAEDIVANAVGARDEDQWAREVAQQRADRMQGKDWQAVKRSVYAYLQRRGFDSEQIWAAIESIEPADEVF